MESEFRLEFVGAVGFHLPDKAPEGVALLMRGGHEHGVESDHGHQGEGHESSLLTGAPKIIHRAILQIQDRFVDEMENVEFQAFPRSRRESWISVPLFDCNLIADTRGDVPRRLGFSYVRPLKGLIPDPTPDPDLKVQSKWPACVDARVFLRGGFLKTLPSLDRRAKNVSWKWVYGPPKDPVVVTSSEATDRVEWRVGLRGHELKLARKKGLDGTIVLRKEEKLIRARIFSLPSVRIEERTSLDAFGTHFALAYDALKVPPPYRPVPIDPGTQTHDLITTCFRCFEV